MPNQGYFEATQPPDRVASAPAELPNSVSDLTGDLHRILSRNQNWADVGIKFDRQAFCRELDAVREIRNAVMHFRDLPQGSTDRAKQFAGIVQIAYLSVAKKK